MIMSTLSFILVCLTWLLAICIGAVLISITIVIIINMYKVVKDLNHNHKKDHVYSGRYNYNSNTYVYHKPDDES